ncbi:MAG: fructose-6-phosphate aldolase [bacterium]
MKIFLDTANLAEIEQAVSWGILDGVTTNPTLMSKAGASDFRAHLKQICDLVQGPVSGEVISLEPEGMLEQAHELAAISPHMVIKVPMTIAGLQVCKKLSTENIAVNMTLIFNPAQALLAAKAGAAYVSPFIGRLDDISHFGMDLIRDIVAIFERYGFETHCLAASLRHPLHVVEAALAGAHVATLPWQVLEKLIHHPLTDMGIHRFLEDWKKIRPDGW